MDNICFTAQAAQIEKGINSHFERARMPSVVQHACRSCPYCPPEIFVPRTVL